MITRSTQSFWLGQHVNESTHLNHSYRMSEAGDRDGKKGRT